MKDLVKNELVSSLGLLIVGIILTIWPDESINIAVNLVGSVVVIFGIANLVIWYKNNTNYASLFLGILAIIVGLFIILRSATVISIIHILLGVAILADGITNMKSLLDVKTNTRSWKILFISAIITSILGIVLIFKPIFIADMIIRIGGIVMILCALEGLFITHKANNFLRK